MNTTFPFNPTAATSAGIHKYDGQLEDYSKAGVDARVAKLKQFEAEFAKLPPDPDRDLVLSTIRASLLEYQDGAQLGAQSGYLFERHHEQCIHHHEPDIRAAGSAPALADRARAEDAAGAGSGAGELEKSAEDLYRDRDSTSSRHLSFFQKDVPLAFKSVTDQKLLAEFRSANDAVIKALGDYQNYLKTDLLAALERRFPLGRGYLREEASIRRNGGYSARPPARNRLCRSAREPAEISRNWRCLSIRPRPRNRFWRRRSRIIRRRINCWRHFAIRSADCGTSSSPPTGDDSFARCCRFSKRRRRLCARLHSLPWIRPGLTKRSPKKLSST